MNWQAKFGHFEMCPVCMSKRYVVCTECGGHYHKHLFGHSSKESVEMPSDVPQPAAAAADTPQLETPALWR